MARTVAQHHADWLNVIETSGPFVTVPVLKRALPQGLEPTPPDLARQVRAAHDEWLTDPDLHGQWVRWVLTDVLDHDATTLAEGPAVPQTLAHTVAEHGVTVRPDLAVLDHASDVPRARLLIRVLPVGAELDERHADDGWAASPLDRVAELLRATGVRLGLVTNGDTWTLVHAKRGGPTTFVTWEAAIWTDERVTLDAFRTLFGAHRFFAVAEEHTLEALLDQSAAAEHEVTDQLGLQVREAVELLVGAFDRADRDSDGQLLRDVDPNETYVAAVTVMMRVVFLLSAEERGLFLLGDPLYDGSYAVSTLLGELTEQSDQTGEEALERRSAAWHRLLATFRMVHGGVQHEDLRLPAYGGSLFDPDRFPFLEGRRHGEAWTTGTARPLPVDDRTVLHILDALQVLKFRRGRRVEEARRLSFRALDVEQIGHVYEGLLDHTAVRTRTPAVGFAGKKEPELAAEDVISYDAGYPRDQFVEWVREETGLTQRQTEKALDSEPDADQRALLVAACENDARLAEDIEPYHGLLRTDLRGLPTVYPAESLYVTQGSERRTTGTYYTPRTLAEEMVLHTLEPLVYTPGPAEGAKREDWTLRSARELLGLRVCDMAMGSGAFLVASCRYLADRLVEAWKAAEKATGTSITVEGDRLDERTADVNVVPDDADERELLARRIVADRCLYGVDRNPMAVEMAKLSLWLITLAKDRPFSFLDHALKCGDSLLGITDLDQLTYLHMDPQRGRELHDGLLFDYQSTWAPLVKDAIEKRRLLESFPVVGVGDAQQKARLHAEAEDTLRTLRIVGDVVVGAAISTVNLGRDMLDGRLLDAAHDVAVAVDPDTEDAERDVRLDDLKDRAAFWLDTDNPPGGPERRTFHWPLEYPEIFLDRPHQGFDAIVGNPPFLGGKRISGPLGSAYREYLVDHVADGTKGNADLVAYFFLRGTALTREGGNVGLLATNTIGQGDTREVGLDRLIADRHGIYRAVRSTPWPSGANLEISKVWLRRGEWGGTADLDDTLVGGITPSLEARSRVSGPAHRLAANVDQSFIGSFVNGIGFVLDPEKAIELIERDPRNRDVLFPYLNGHDLNSSPTQAPSRWVINFHDWPLERAEQYQECLEIARQRVKPHRDGLPDYKHRVRDNWWRFEHSAPALYKAIADLGRVLIITRVSRLVMPAFVATGVIPSEATAVFAYDDDAHFGLLSSAFHWWWAVTHASTMRTDVRYTPSDCFSTFPQPTLTEDMAEAGRALGEHRRIVMIDRHEGLTATYNRVDDPDERSDDLAALRELHVELDHAVAAAYGWGDLDLEHDFRDTRQGVRYTLDPATTTEILDRLLELNHERYTDEVRRGLHDRKPAAKKKRAKGQASFDGL